ncbi:MULTISPECIES: Fe-S-containing hydro-lyase [unclassified Candidatus Frackibacter]|uniref:Fe-S-containing hydro-lyase n=1 Tax=unclassified Candidatus Frackibacter TaxID=2648818 RepID=UPI000887DBB4|nr:MULTISPECIES: Fe-S-containing hydro-lyase [unclassified Candidatus Frackibacter]SDC57251.1 fumarate hydratase subunit beta [Candidatus Frackibacter sp. WG11]SEM71377.1 fumarate hydratase subunit beta [Candidatus Frackibacter sp. WG12]SFL82898.1 fumarate hydratase subunit beta [Candidatus Frackibacter sp. WG13]
MAEIKLTTPLTEEKVRELEVGDKVLLSGTIYTGRDAAHERLVNLLEEGEDLPIDVDGQVIYYVGPAPAKPGKPIGSAGPTTSYRMDPYTPALLNEGLRGMIGKGSRSQEVKDVMEEEGAVYFAAVGGAAALIAKCIKKAEVVAYEDLGTEAIRKLEIEDLPLIVVNDAANNDLYEIGAEEYSEV